MNFRCYRAEMGWTLEDAARLLNVKDGSTIARHEIGACMPSFETLGLYDKLTGGKVTVQDFIAMRREFKADPDWARKKVGARRIIRARRPALT